MVIHGQIVGIEIPATDVARGTYVRSLRLQHPRHLRVLLVVADAFSFCSVQVLHRDVRLEVPSARGRHYPRFEDDDFYGSWGYLCRRRRHVLG